MYPEILERISRPIPSPYVVSGSTPVISFGDFTKARVATLGINPSSGEFNNKKGLLPPPDKRLVDRHSLGAANGDFLNEPQAQETWSGCKSYFQNNPYWSWFRDLEDIMKPIGTSYENSSACHLDLVQWATQPVWGRLPKDQTVVNKLIEDDREFFLWQLAHPNIGLRLLNGRSVCDEVSRSGLFKLQNVGGFSYQVGSKTHKSQLLRGVGSNGQMTL